MITDSEEYKRFQNHFEGLLAASFFETLTVEQQNDDFKNVNLNDYQHVREDIKANWRMFVRQQFPAIQRFIETERFNNELGDMEFIGRAALHQILHKTFGKDEGEKLNDAYYRYEQRKIANVAREIS